MPLYNRNNASTTVQAQFAALPPQPAETLAGPNKHAGAAPSSLKVRDVWEKKDLGCFNATYSAQLEAHETKVFILRPTQVPETR